VKEFCVSATIYILLFIFSGLFALVCFSPGRFFGFDATFFGLDDMEVSKSTLLYVIGGMVLILGGLTRTL